MPSADPPQPQGPTPQADPVALSALRPDEAGVICEVGDGPAGRRLLDLGFLPGTAIRVLRRAPLGDPTSYELRGTRLCLRRAEARLVQVRVRREPGAGPTRG